MTTFNKGIRTQAGKDLANRVMAGKTSITYSRLVFSSEDLSDKSDDELSELTDVEPQELAVEPDTIDLKATDVTDPETEVRAIAKNDPLTEGLHVRTYGLYAKDDSGNEILFGVALDDNPAYLPPHESGDQDQYLTYEWDTALKDTDNIKFTNTKMVFVNFDELDRYKSAVNTTVASLEADDTNLSNSTKADYANAAGSISSLQDSAASYTDYRAGRVMIQANENMETNRVSLSNSVNGLPHWVDINYTRSNVAPSLATSARNAANGYTYGMASSINDQLLDKQNQINNRATIADRDWTRNVVGPSLANSAKDAATNYATDRFNTVSADASSSVASVMNQANINMETNRVSLSNSLNGLPNWNDLNWTRNQLAPALANSAADSAKNDANNYANGKSDSLTARVQSNENNISSHYQGGKDLKNTDLDTVTTPGTYKGVWGAGNTNTPNNDSFIMHVYTNGYGDVFQRIFTYQGAFIRTVSGKVWHKLIYDDDINNLQNQINALPTTTQVTTRGDALQGEINQNKSNISAQYNGGTTLQNTDLNTVDTPGTYMGVWDGNNSNTPNHDSFVMYVFKNAFGDVYQQAFTYEGVFVRTLNFKVWHKVAFDENINDLQNQIKARGDSLQGEINNINGKPNWSDVNYTRNVTAPNLATNAMNQANAYTNDKINGVQNSINGNYQPKQPLSHTDLNNVTTPGSYYGIWAWHNINTPNNDTFIMHVFSDNGGDVFQVVMTYQGAFYRSLTDKKWLPLTQQVKTASNEGDARNQSNQQPGTLFIYSD